MPWNLEGRKNCELYLHNNWSNYDWVLKYSRREFKKNLWYLENLKLNQLFG